ncbi:helix-turn-helix domain-containing protein [Paraburkholderia phosphatilytica]|uniref:helix-turn-helix domain-containing protein n=1 Tax=Paraburkholderia phosphatilytica TaxID=2282883 RepID=UPI000E4C9995|nr:helix-turn-helix domain-containing protein [Paraburkholderia phosphatilytica]
MKAPSLPYQASATACVDARPDEAPVNRRFECDDVDAHARCMTGWSIHLDQLSPGPFHGMLHEIHVDGVQLLRERVNRALLKRGDASQHTTSFSVPLETAGAGYCAGTPLQERMLLVSSGTSLPELRTPDQHDVAVLTVSSDALRAVASLDDGDTALPLSEAACLVALSGPRYDTLKTFLLESFGAAETVGEAFDHPQMRKALHDAVLLELAHIVEHAQDPVRLDRTARHRIVARVRELVIAKPDVPFTVLDICHAVGTSRRKLQYCFEETLGTHPAHYLRVLRLNAVRRELRRHSHGAASVSDVAFRWGFWHLSRFATHYRQLFGELPSETLKRPPQ